MKINFLVNPVVGGWEPTDTRLGGTEESVVRWSEELASRGHKVWVFRNGRQDMNIYGGKPPAEWAYEHNGVHYWSRSYHDGGDATINIKSSEIKPDKVPMFYLTNETDATRLDLSAYEAVIWPSQWAVDNIPVNNKTVILPHGYDSEKIKPGVKIPKQCLYASSPDRGLDYLLRVWPEVRKLHPDATLIVTYGAPAQPVDGVMFMGDVDEDTMNELYATSDVWVHPCSGGELYGITGIKAQAAGCVPVYFPMMALAETVKQGVACDEFNFVHRLSEVLGDEKLKADIRGKLKQEHFVDWQESTDILEKIIGAKNGDNSRTTKPKS